MKFISKQVNYGVDLRHGQPSEPITGRNAVPGLYVRFEDGIANVDDEETCKLMLNHEAFDSDFILAEEDTKDPWEDTRRSSEPDHTITEIKYGHVEKSVGKPVSTLSRDQQVAVKKMAQEIAAEIAPKMAMDMLEKLMEKKEKESSKEDKKTKKTTSKKTTDIKK